MSPSLQEFLRAPAPRTLPFPVSGELEFVLSKQNNRLIVLIMMCGLLPVGLAIPLGARAAGWVGVCAGLLVAVAVAVAGGYLLHGLFRGARRRLLERAESREGRVVQMEDTTVQTDSVYGRVAAYSIIVRYPFSAGQEEQRGLIIQARHWRHERPPVVGDEAVVLIPPKQTPMRHIAIGGRLVASATEEPHVWFK